VNECIACGCISGATDTLNECAWTNNYVGALFLA
jgi:succinate dehydrogenase/fumarate reductase-like Fe-S protein